MPRPDKQEPVVFDLVEEHGPDAAAGTDEGPDAAAEPLARPPLLVRLSRVPRRTWLLTAAAVTVVAVAVAAVDLVRDDRREELMRTSSVGVASLADPPAEIWRVPFDTLPEQGQDMPLDQQVVTMGPLLVVPPAKAQSQWVAPAPDRGEPVLPGFEDVVAIDPERGEVAWRVPLGDHPTCGPTGYDASTSTEALVCVHGADDVREVLTIAPDGSTRARSADLAQGEQVFPGPDGLAVRTSRTGEPAGAVACEPSVGCSPEFVTTGRDLLVVAEDARTGTARWRAVVDFDPMNSMNCQATVESGERLTVESAVDTDVVAVRAGAGTVVVDGCGVSATLSVSGTRLDLAVAADGSSPAWVTELDPGRFALQGEGPGTTVVDEAGETLQTLNGWVRVDATSPDAPDDLWFVTTRTDGSGFEAQREDGSVAWSERYGWSVLLAGRDVVVVDRGNTVVGLERSTGAELWTWSRDGLAGLARYRTLTDGEALALAHLSRDGVGEGRFVTLDLDTGEQLWDMPTTGPVVAVGGHLVEFTREGVRGLG
ncbi:PQQ-binding-like beta-propeller repeat protein [Promicromonospora iranensis]|uniref:outer membrane protein assembly factor BamB family protein n=1 Tax=Promicromonospora iranensis TaxID=1105144 RepID=UPI0023A95522|nr:PQQ-binding-like beta-propeller repeat protein [Promicromonospora iranensis]